MASGRACFSSQESLKLRRFFSLIALVMDDGDSMWELKEFMPADMCKCPTPSPSPFYPSPCPRLAFQHDLLIAACRQTGIATVSCNLLGPHAVLAWLHCPPDNLHVAQCNLHDIHPICNTWHLPSSLACYSMSHYGSLPNTARRRLYSKQEVSNSTNTVIETYFTNGLMKSL